MRKVLHFLKCILLLAYLVFIVLCTHSCLMAFGSQSGSDDSASLGSALLTPATHDVTLSSGTYPEDISELNTVVTASDLALLERFPSLRSADFSGSTCYEEILSWSALHEGVSVRYTVTLPDGQTVDNLSEVLDLSGMNPADASRLVEPLRYLPNLRTVDLGVGQAGSSISAEDLAAIQSACPNAVLNYSLDLFGQEIRLADTELNVSSVTPDQVQTVASVASGMSNLRTIHLGGEQNGLSWDLIRLLHDAAPSAVLDYSFTLWGVSANLSDTELSFSHITMNDQGAAVRTIVPLMVNLRTLDMDTCGVSNENMAVIRDENPSVNVIWRIWFATNYSVRTDVERILASSTAKGGTVTDSEAAKLQYCTKVRFLDLGHNKVLTDISFARCMPELEVLILAINDISDISPLAECPKLEYLEINSTNVTDLTPLSQSMALRHLNIGRTAKSDTNNGEDLDRPRVSDISPLYGLKDLERLWIGSVTAPSIPAEQIEHMQECAPNCVINTDAGDPSQGEWRTSGERPNWVWEQWMQTGVFNDPLNERYTLLREQFQYDLGDAAYSLAQNDPLY